MSGVQNCVVLSFQEFQSYVNKERLAKIMVLSDSSPTPRAAEPDVGSEPVEVSVSPSFGSHGRDGAGGDVRGPFPAKRVCARREGLRRLSTNGDRITPMTVVGLWNPHTRTPEEAREGGVRGMAQGKCEGGEGDGLKMTNAI